MKKKKNGGRAVFTAAVLLILVIAAAWMLKTRGKGEEVPAAAEKPEVTETVPEEPPVQEKPAEPEEPKESADPSAEEEAARIERERAAFVPDYDSFPLLETTPIRYLSMEVGATPEEVRFNWMSPSGQAGKITWYTVQSGDFSTYDAECTPSSSMPGYYVNKVTVPNVEPGCTYAYRVGNDAGGWSPEYHYAVPADREDGFTFLVTSDAQIGQAQLEDMETTAETWDKVVTRLTDYVPEAEFLFHLGDQVANYGEAAQYDGFLNHLGLYGIPLAPVVGNHDVPNEDTLEDQGYPAEPYFYEHFNVPNRSETYGQSRYDKDGNYHFVRDNVLFIVLNSNTIQPLDIHESYVPEVVARYPDVKWRILVQHYPAYSGVAKYQEKLDEWMKNSLAYIAENNDIDLVLSGHDHAYSRSAFTDISCSALEGYDYSKGATAVNPEGTMYVTCSTASGCIYQEITPDPENRHVFQGQPKVPVALRVDVSDTELHLTAYQVDSWTVYDEYTIRKE